MKKPGAIYHGEESRRYLAVYNYHHDIHTMLPEEIQSSQRLAHISYSRGSKKGGIDVFLLNPSAKTGEVINIKKDIHITPTEIRTKFHEDNDTGNYVPLNYSSLEGVDKAYGVRVESLRDLGSIEKEFSIMALTDILLFCGQDLAKNPQEPRVQYTDIIIPRTEMRKITPKKMLKGGKAEFVPQCILEANIDFTTGCITSWIPGENPEFDGKTFIDYYSYPWGDCDYCYAENKHKMFPKSIRKFDQQMLYRELMGEARLIFGSDEPVGKPVEFLRFGKRTEPWTPYTEDDFIQTLETMVDTGTRGIITTKFLPYSPEVSKLLKRTKSVVLYSTGESPEVERGPILHGADQDFRLENATKYREDKVNAALFHLFNPPFPPTEQDLEILNYATAHNIPVQILPLRFMNKALANKLLPELAEQQNTLLWNILKDTRISGQEDIFSEELEWANTYDIRAGVLVPKIDGMHPFWTKLVGKNKGGKMRMCHHDENTVYCGGCFVKPGVIEPMQHIELNPNGKSKMWGRKKKGKFVDLRQEILQL